jgi:acetate kinase
MESLKCLGVVFNEEANNVRGKEALLTDPSWKIKCYVIPTDEELMMAKETYQLSK